MTPDGYPGRVVSGVSAGFQEGDSDGAVLVEVEVNGVSVQRLFNEDDLLDKL
jgi:hypothetical protein